MSKFRNFPMGWITIILLTTIPLIRWLQLESVHIRFFNSILTLKSVGQITGIIGICLFALSLILSARISLLDILFQGMNNAYIVHHRIGGISLLFLLVHPVTLAFTHIPESWIAAAAILIPGSDWALNFGISSLLLLIGLLVLTFFVNLPYEIWRQTHKFLGVALFFGILHGFFIESDISRDPLLRLYILGLSLMSFCAYLYRTVFERKFVHKIPYIVNAVTEIAKDIVEITFVPTGTEQLLFKPGQFVYVTVETKGVENQNHPFSISSAPNPNNFTLTVKALGDFSRWIKTLKPGTLTHIEGPYGHFSYMYSGTKSTLWIGGGIGITPFVSMARSLVPGKSPDVILYYCMHDEKDSVYLPELEQIAGVIPNFRVIPWYSMHFGRLTADAIVRNNGDIHAQSVYICGPTPFMHSLKDQLHNVGVAKRNIHTEDFAMI